MRTLKIGISAGDTAGIGMEVILKALADPAVYSDISPVIYGAAEFIDETLSSLQSIDVPYTLVGPDTPLEPGKVYVRPVWTDMPEHLPGRPSKASGQRAFQSLSIVVDDLLSGTLDAMVTAPIDKSNIQQEGFYFPGHTEYLAARCNSQEVLMLLVSGGLRVGVITGHIPLSAVSQAINIPLIVEKSRMVYESLRADFGIASPRIAILGLNPHAGDGGLLGREELDSIGPAIRVGQEAGLPLEGPFPADGFFGSSMRKDYDAVLAMYHDQGLAPFKALSFGGGVNFTAGLSIVRTSPDHGTAFGIAGKNIADGSSFQSALRMAVEVVKSRNTGG